MFSDFLDVLGHFGSFWVILDVSGRFGTFWDVLGVVLMKSHNIQLLHLG